MVRGSGWLYHGFAMQRNGVGLGGSSRIEREVVGMLLGALHRQAVLYPRPPAAQHPPTILPPAAPAPPQLV